MFRLVLSYKYSRRLFHHVYNFAPFKCSEENGVMLVRVPPKQLTRVHDLHTRFVPKLSQVIKEITRNINFVEKEMQAEDIMLAEVCRLSSCGGNFFVCLFVSSLFLMPF